MSATIRYWDDASAPTWATINQGWNKWMPGYPVVQRASRSEGASGGVGTSAGEYSPTKWDDALAYLSVTAKSGTTPTIDVVYQTSPDLGSTWYDHTAFTQIGDATGTEVIKIDNPGQYFRFQWTIGGTSTPTYTFAIDIEGKHYRRQ